VSPILLYSACLAEVRTTIHRTLCAKPPDVKGFELAENGFRPDGWIRTSGRILEEKAGLDSRPTSVFLRLPLIVVRQRLDNAFLELKVPRVKIVYRGPSGRSIVYSIKLGLSVISRVVGIEAESGSSTVLTIYTPKRTDIFGLEPRRYLLIGLAFLVLVDCVPCWLKVDFVVLITCSMWFVLSSIWDAYRHGRRVAKEVKYLNNLILELFPDGAPARD
jgi:hypothetical protein